MLQVSKLSFSYTDKAVLTHINLDLQPGEYLSIIGESGSGKSTLLKLIYGLLNPDSGSISWKDQKLLGPLYNLVPGEDFIKYQAQDYDLMPSLTAGENVGKYLSNFYPRKKQKRIRELLELVDMSEFADRKPPELSGGQQQRIALARVLAKPPELLLLDEPFSNIDNFRKNNLRRNVFSYLKDHKIACIVATHDNQDSLSFADKTMVLRKGKTMAADSPLNLYKNPPNKYTARLFGEVNEVPGEMAGIEGKKNVLVYPSELIYDEAGLVDAKVKASWFEGNHYLISAYKGRRTFYFHHAVYLAPGTPVRLSVDRQALEYRRS
ncbi:ABC transporter ATP-binding protein [Robertkochia aurantiaca]|uniref:ABC transporter ATP-binding protein n=1 Tax=Robertkochia aurantiaca TaxID=2873700 RepID=UPI001CCD9FAF|nr:ABC transporter ATP-binding protein [Robertkochia sp. 3YJGBD-33]